nr:MAG: hypothetical protein [Microvirus Sku12]
MNRFDTYCKKTKCSGIVSCVLKSDEPEAVPNCAYTPSEMYQMMLNGEPISMPPAPQTSEQGQDNPDWGIELTRKRGVDVADLWNAQREARSRLDTAYRRRKAINDEFKAIQAREDAAILEAARAPKQEPSKSAE